MSRAFPIAGLAAGLAAARCRRGTRKCAARSRLAMPLLRWQFLRRAFARIRAWRSRRGATQPVVSPTFINFVSYASSIYRDVTPHGVRVFSLCGCCGSRLNASATLCEECAQKRRPARPI
jgi:hypothetical protein